MKFVDFELIFFQAVYRSQANYIDCNEKSMALKHHYGNTQDNNNWCDQAFITTALYM